MPGRSQLLRLCPGTLWSGADLGLDSTSVWHYAHQWTVQCPSPYTVNTLGARIPAQGLAQSRQGEVSVEWMSE